MVDVAVVFDGVFFNAFICVYCMDKFTRHTHIYTLCLMIILDIMSVTSCLSHMDNKFMYEIVKSTNQKEMCEHKEP